MRDYGKVFCAIWASDDFRSLPEDGRMLALYLLTCQHCTAVGAFRLPDAYAADDLQWTAERVSKGFVELSRNGFATRDERTKWVFIPKFLDWNKIENPNQAKSAAKLIDQIPDVDAKPLLLEKIRTDGRYLSEFGISVGSNPSETLPKPGAVTGAVTVTGAGAVTKPPATPPAAPDGGAENGQRFTFKPPSWVPADAWAAFVDMRRKIRAPLTNHAAKLAIDELDGLRASGDDPEAVLNQSGINTNKLNYLWMGNTFNKRSNKLGGCL
jgi:hypothetical protein